jgi:hypothetical protein
VTLVPLVRVEATPRRLCRRAVAVMRADIVCVQLESLITLKGEVIKQFLASRGLSRTPVDRHRQTAFDTTTSSQALIHRKDGYAVRFIDIDGEAVPTAVEQGLTIHVVRVDENSDDSAIFTEVKRTLHRLRCCFVALKSPRKLSVTVVKWIAELTNAHPWVFVFLDTHISIVDIVPELKSRWVGE